MLIYPDYYKEFRCIADKCRHNCCIGWEIEIDKDTKAYYDTVDGEFGRRLSENIKDGENPEFILAADECCPFLNGDNLCDIILTLGEDKLCHICREHPRFYNEICGRVEAGLGLSCEEAARIILGRKEKTVLVSDEEISSDDEILFLRDKIISKLQDRKKSIRMRLFEVLALCNASLPERGVEYWAEFLLSLEYMDKTWQERIAALKILSNVRTDKFDTYMKDRETEYEQLGVYLIYRHLATAADIDDAAARACFAVFGVWLVYALGLCEFLKHGKFSFEDQVELCRMFSTELEYCEENTEALFDEFYVGT